MQNNEVEKLRQFFKSRRSTLKIQGFCEEAKIGYSTFNKIMAGTYIPSMVLINKIKMAAQNHGYKEQVTL